MPPPGTILPAAAEQKSYRRTQSVRWPPVQVHTTYTSAKAEIEEQLKRRTSWYPHHLCGPDCCMDLEPLGPEQFVLSRSTRKKFQAPKDRNLQTAGIPTLAPTQHCDPQLLRRRISPEDAVSLDHSLIQVKARTETETIQIRSSLTFNSASVHPLAEETFKTLNRVPSTLAMRRLHWCITYAGLTVWVLDIFATIVQSCFAEKMEDVLSVYRLIHLDISDNDHSLRQSYIRLAEIGIRQECSRAAFCALQVFPINQIARPIAEGIARETVGPRMLMMIARFILWFTRVCNYLAFYSICTVAYILWSAAKRQNRNGQLYQDTLDYMSVGIVGGALLLFPYFRLTWDLVFRPFNEPLQYKTA